MSQVTEKSRRKRVPESLLRQSEPAHQGSVAGIGVDGVERGITQNENQVAILNRICLFKVLERLITIANERKAQSEDRRSQDIVGPLGDQPVVALGVCAL